VQRNPRRRRMRGEVDLKTGDPQLSLEGLSSNERPNGRELGQNVARAEERASRGIWEAVLA
jgi:hypothetical protein